jgi:nucleotide-binding universal stress UspA family protein
MSAIVVGADFTPCSAAGLRQAIRIAAWRRATVHAVHAIEPLVVTDLEQALSPLQTDIRAGLIQDARRAWTEFTAGIPGAVGLGLTVEVDHPVSALLRHVRERSAELLVLGVHGTSPADRGAGTLAMACSRKAMTSVLLVKEAQAGPFASIVACVDFSETSRRALEAALRVAVQDHAVLHVLHVFDPPWHRLHYRAPTPQASPDYQKQYRDGLRRQLEAFCEPYRDELARLETRYAVFDSSGQSAGIIEFIRQVAADLVVLGTRGRTKLLDMLLGSTAERVVREAPCSLLTVKPEGFEHPLGR